MPPFAAARNSLANKGLHCQKTGGFLASIAVDRHAVIPESDQISERGRVAQFAKIPGEPCGDSVIASIYEVIP